MSSASSLYAYDYSVDRGLFDESADDLVLQKKKRQASIMLARCDIFLKDGKNTTL